MPRTLPILALFALLISFSYAAAAEPEIEDGKVVFRITAPQAKQVTVGGEWGGAAEPMVRDDKGIWTLAKTLEPNIYSYTFRVDGVPMVDPRNGRVKTGRTAANYVEVPGPTPAFYAQQDVPHGIISTHGYKSRVSGGQRQVVVYTPPDYEADSSRKFPVLYLLHGSGDDETGWTAYGRAHWIADNLLSQQKMQPMIIVMPNGHMFDYTATKDPNPSENASKDSASPAPSFRIGLFERDLLGDVMPLVEKRYRVKTSSADRALMGLSMGGRQTFEVGLHHPELFGYLGVYSSGASREAKDEMLELAIANPQAYNAQLHMFWIGCGRDDRAFAGAEQIDKRLTEAGVRHVFHATSGSHNWTVWRDYLRETLPMLFQEHNKRP